MYRSRPTHVSLQTVGMPTSIRGKQNVHFSALPVRWLKYTFLYGQPVMHIRQPRHRSWSTSTMPSSLRLYIAPDGHDATHAGLRQCSQMRGRKNRNDFSYSCRTRSETCASTGSPAAIWLPPPNESSQFADHVTSVSLPVSNDFGRATGVSSPAGAVIRC